MTEDKYTQSPTMWFQKDAALKELMDLKFAFAALAEQSGTPGSFEREMAKNAAMGFRRRVDYLYDSFIRLLKDSK